MKNNFNTHIWQENEDHLVLSWTLWASKIV